MISIRGVKFSHCKTKSCASVLVLNRAIFVPESKL